MGEEVSVNGDDALASSSLVTNNEYRYLFHVSVVSM